MRLNRLVVLLLAATLAVAPSGAQGPVDNNITAPGDNVVLDLVEDVGQGLGDAVDGTGHAIESAGKGLASGLSAAGRALGAVAAAVGDAAIAVAQGVTTVGGLVAASLASAGIGAVRGSYDAVGLIGSLAGAAAALVGRSAAFAGAFVGGLSLDGLLAYVGFVANLRPAAMPPVAFGAVAVTGATASAGVGGWAGWNALRKWGVLGPLGGLGGMAGFSRIQDNQLLEHPVRGQIFQTIQATPGIHASQIARDMGVGWGTVTHHLTKLEKARLVAARTVNNHKCYFENGGTVSRADMEVASALKNDTASGIAAFVVHHPMASQKQVAEALGISAALTSFHVKKLVSYGVLEKMRHGKETLLTTSEAMRRVLSSQDDPIATAIANRADAGFEFVS